MSQETDILNENWRSLILRAADKHLAHFQDIRKPYLARGILHSEMLCVCSLCAELGVDVIIESGRYNGQSTSTLGAFFPHGPRIISIEWDAEDSEKDQIARAYLATWPHLELLNGDSRKMMPGLLQEHAGKRVALLIDGPKDDKAIALVRASLSHTSAPVCAFIHDVAVKRCYTPFMRHFPVRFTTNDLDYRHICGDIDSECAPRYVEFKKPGAPPLMPGEDAGMWIYAQRKCMLGAIPGPNVWRGLT